MPKVYKEVLRFTLFNNNLTEEDLARKRPEWGNSDLSKTKGMPETITLSTKPTRVDGGMRYLAGGAWKWDDGNITLALQYVTDSEVQDDFD